MSKPVSLSKAKSDSGEPYSGIPIPFYVPNVLGYIRFILIIASWPFAMHDPTTFLSLYGTAVFLGAIDGSIAKYLN